MSDIKATEARLAELGIVRTPVEWATTDHKALHPEHIGVCKHCHNLFDREVDRTTGLHRDKGGRPSDYCSQAHQDARTYRRRVGRDTDRDREVAEANAAYKPSERPMFTDVRSMLTYLRVRLATDDVFCPELLRAEWRLLEKEAPDVTQRLVWFDHWTDAHSHMTRVLAKGQRKRAEELAAQVVTAIDDWFRAVNALRGETV